MAKKLIRCEDCGLVYDYNKYGKCPNPGCTEARLEKIDRDKYDQEQQDQSIEEGFYNRELGYESE